VARVVHGCPDIVIRPIRMPSSAPRRPRGSMLRAAVGPAAVALALLGCATGGNRSITLVYSGTMSAQTSGRAAMDLGYQEARVVGCKRTGPPSPADDFIVLSSQCVVDARGEGLNVIGVPGTECTLRIDGQRHTLRVTDATLRFGPRIVPSQPGFVPLGHGRIPWRHGGFLTVADPRTASIDVGGDESDERGGHRHVLITFDGRQTEVLDAENVCTPPLPETQSPKPKMSNDAKSEEDAGFEARGL
jgi:hypothetical protein